MTRTRIRLTLLTGIPAMGALLCWAFGGGPAAAAAPHARNGLIAFDYVLGGIYTVHADGSGKHRLTSSGVDPAFSPDGKTIVYATKSGLVIMDVNGSHRHLIPNSDPVGNGQEEFPSFAPDGSEIVFDDQSGGIYTIRPDGSSEQRLTKDYAGSPVFTPSGKRIVFNDYSRKAIISMRADGTGPKVRVRGTRSNNDVCPCSFSPNGRRFVFTSALTSMYQAVFIVNADGRGRHQISHPPFHRIDVGARFSPNGKQLLVDRTGYGYGDIVIMNPNGTHVRTVATHTPGYGDATWQPIR